MATQGKRRTLPARPPAGRYREQYGVIVICQNARDQERIYKRFRKDGLKCRVVCT